MNMKMMTLFCFMLLSFCAQAKLIEENGELLIVNSHNGQFVTYKKVQIGNETNGEFTVLSDLIFHQALKVYVVNPLNGKVSQIDLDEKSEFYGSVEIVSGLIVRHDNKLYLVNPNNGKTKSVKSGQI